MNKHVSLAWFIGWLIILAIGPTATVAAAESVPPLINYQGALTDANGAPMAGVVNSMEFNLYDAPTGGNVIWGPQIYATVPLIGGKFNVLLGPTDGNGNLITTAFADKTRYLSIKIKIKIEDEYKEILPRQQILSTPFAIQAQEAQLAKNGVPPGTILAYGGTSIPAGYLLCDGAAVSRSSYNALFATIGTVYGVGDGTTTFNLPDLRGQFLRGLNIGRNDGKQDPEGGNRSLGSYQSDEYKSHTHQERPALGSNWFNRYSSGGTWGNERDGNVLDGQTGPSGGIETRPKNTAVYYIVRANQ